MVLVLLARVDLWTRRPVVLTKWLLVVIRDFVLTSTILLGISLPVLTLSLRLLCIICIWGDDSPPRVVNVPLVWSLRIQFSNLPSNITVKTVTVLPGNVRVTRLKIVEIMVILTSTTSTTPPNRLRTTL